jgi:hypothetical protein
MFTLKFIGNDKETGHQQELMFTARSVRRDGSDFFYTDEHENEIEMLELDGRTVYVMNENGATVSTHRF